MTDAGRQLAPISARGRISAPGPSGVPRGGDRQHVGSLVERVADVPLDPGDRPLAAVVTAEYDFRARTEEKRAVALAAVALLVLMSSRFFVSATSISAL